MGVNLVLKWDGECTGWYTGEPATFLHETEGTVIALDEAGTGETLAGKFHLYYVDADGALNAGVSLFDVMDSQQTTCDYFDALIDPETHAFKDSVLALFDDDILGANILILDRLELLPAFRGERLGLQLICEMIRRFSPGAAVVAMKPYPLQFEGHTKRADWGAWDRQLGLPDLSGDERRCTAKLRAYYAGLGFVRLGRTPYMLRCGLEPLPDLGD